jgi:hypothetical protein
VSNYSTASGRVRIYKPTEMTWMDASGNALVGYSKIISGEVTARMKAYEKYPFYGITDGSQFWIKDLKDKNASSKINASGRVCSTIDKVAILDMLYSLGGRKAVEYSELPTEIKLITLESKGLNDLLSEWEKTLEGETDEDAARRYESLVDFYHSWIESDKGYICSVLASTLLKQNPPRIYSMMGPIKESTLNYLETAGCDDRCGEDEQTGPASASYALPRPVPIMRPAVPPSRAGVSRTASTPSPAVRGRRSGLSKLPPLPASRRAGISTNK